MTQRHLRVKLMYCFFDPACSILSKDQLHRESSCFKTNPYPRIHALARSAFVWCECVISLYCCVCVCVCEGMGKKLHVCKRGVQLVTQKMKTFSSFILVLSFYLWFIKWKFLLRDCSIIMSYFQNTSHLCKVVSVWLAAPYTYVKQFFFSFFFVFFSFHFPEESCSPFFFFYWC